VKTDRRDAKRLVRLFAAGELSFAFVPSEADEQFRDLVRCIDDVRKDLMRSRHRLSKFLLRRGLRFSGRQWTQPYERWLRKLTFDDALSRATFIDSCCAVDALVQRRLTLIAALEDAVPASSHARTIARLRCFRGIDTLSAAGLCAEVGTFERFCKPNLLSGFLGIVPCEYTSDLSERLRSLFSAVVKKRGVECPAVLRRACGGVVAGLRAVPGRCTQRDSKVRVFEQLLGTLGEGRGITWLDQVSRLSIENGLGERPDARRDDRDSERHRFAGDSGQPLRPRLGGKPEHVEGTRKPRHVVLWVTDD